MANMRIFPSGRLALDMNDTSGTKDLSMLAEFFSADWREGLFILDARRNELPASPNMRF